jgi:phage terminase large subunit-like protein
VTVAEQEYPRLPLLDIPPAQQERILRRLDLPQKVRLRWRLNARTKQLTPGPHRLCTNPTTDDCDRVIADSLTRYPNTPNGVQRAWDDLRADPDWVAPVPLSGTGTVSQAEVMRQLGDAVLSDARLRYQAARGHTEWLIWLLLAGRGWGKTRTGAEDVLTYALSYPGSRIALVAATFADGRDTMVEGDSGLLAIVPKSLVQDWNRSLGELVLTNGSRFKLFTAEKPERLRGPQHHRAWADELASWMYLKDTWDMMMFGLRLGRHPQVVVTTTPKPLKFLRTLLKRAQQPGGGVVVTTGSMYENVKNLARAAVQELREAYEGTRLGRQELHAEVLDDAEGALWHQSTIDLHRAPPYVLPDETAHFQRIVIGVDPAVTSGEDADETGIIIVGLSRGPCPFCDRQQNPAGRAHAFVLQDASKKHLEPTQWADRVADRYRRWQADRVVAEANQGGDLVISTLRGAQHNMPVTKVIAKRGKILRAEPVAALYERGLVHHVGSKFPELEEQMTTFSADPDNQDFPRGESPDRMDALVYALTELMLPVGGLHRRGQADPGQRHRGRR